MSDGSKQRVRRAGGRVWLDGVPRLGWGGSPEPTYLGALEAAFRSSERPLDVTTLMGDSGLGFRLRWALTADGSRWCGSGPCGEWPEEVAAVNAATGYVFTWEPPEARRPLPPEKLCRIVEHIERGFPILGYGLQYDVSVFYGYEDEGRRVLVSDYWASEDPCVMSVEAAKSIDFFLERIDAPLPRPAAVRAGLALAVRRWREGLVEGDPMKGSTYYYGAAGYERWIADLERAVGSDSDALGNLYFANGWTYSSLHMNRSEHAARYLRENAEHLPPAARPHLDAAAECYDRMRERLGPWDRSSPLFGFVKQQPLDTWTPEVRAREIALLRDLCDLDARAIDAIARALRD